MERKADISDVNPVSELAGQLCARIESALARIGSRKKAASDLSVSVDSLTRYVRGEQRPPFEFIVRLAHASGQSVGWFAGENAQGGQARGAVDTARLSQAIETLEEVLEMTGRVATPQVKAELVVSIYELFGAEAEHAAPSHTAQILRLVRTNT